MTAEEALALCVKALRDVEWERDDDDGYACCPSCQASRSQKYSHTFIIGKHDEGCLLSEALAAAEAYKRAKPKEPTDISCKHCGNATMHLSNVCFACTKDARRRAERKQVSDAMAQLENSKALRERIATKYGLEDAAPKPAQHEVCPHCDGFGSREERCACGAFAAADGKGVGQ